jgi:hypothetical protein
LVLHRDGKAGEVIGTANLGATKKGCTDLQFMDSTVPLRHKRHLFHSTDTNFSIDNKMFHWTGYDELVEDGTKRVVAKFRPNWWLDNTHQDRVGCLDVNQSGIIDLVVFTALVVEERAEGKLPPFYQL